MTPVVVRALPLLLLLACTRSSPAPADAGETDAGPCASPNVSDASLRRLTAEELGFTTSALLSSDAALDLPPDDDVQGYDTLAPGVPSAAFVERHLDSVLALASKVDVRAVAGCRPESSEPECTAHFLDGFVTKAFRRPLSAAQRARFESLYAKERALDDEATARQTLLAAVLASPEVLYRFEQRVGEGEVALLDGWSLATRLSYFFWAEAPDDALLDAAATGGLATREQVRTHAQRLLAHPKAAQGVRRFHLQWLKVRGLASTHKSLERHPSFEAQRGSMLEEAGRFAEWAVLQGDGHFERLLEGRVAFVDPTLAALYRFPDPGEGFHQVSTVGTARLGVLTLGAVLASAAKSDQSSPVLRGKLVRERFFCQVPAPPPGTVVTLLPPPTSGTTRERFTAHVADERCQGCHRLLDPIGFGLEGFDAVGAYRTTENGAAIDDRGELQGTDVDGPFRGAAELAGKLSQSAEVRRCYAEQLFRFGLARHPGPDDACSVASALDAFEAGRDVRALMVAWATSDAFRFAREAK